MGVAESDKLNRVVAIKVIKKSPFRVGLPFLLIAPRIIALGPRLVVPGIDITITREPGPTSSKKLANS